MLNIEKDYLFDKKIDKQNSDFYASGKYKTFND
jgi:hypothetical protein